MAGLSEDECRTVIQVLQRIVANMLVVGTRDEESP
jgi:hypothetical protein